MVLLLDPRPLNPSPPSRGCRVNPGVKPTADPLTGPPRLTPDGPDPAECSQCVAAASLLLTLHQTSTGVLVQAGLIGIVQNNVLGSAEFHRQQSWPFDPDAGGRRAAEFIALHGDKSERLIERVGLGLDGRQDERREQQTVRDYLYDQRQRQQANGDLPPGYRFQRRPSQTPVGKPAGVSV